MDNIPSRFNIRVSIFQNCSGEHAPDPLTFSMCYMMQCPSLLDGLTIFLWLATALSSSSAAAAGVTTNDILKAADWIFESVFRNFYYRPTGDVTYGRAVLSWLRQWGIIIVLCIDISAYGCSAVGGCGLNFTTLGYNTIDMWVWAFWNIISKWLRSCSDCMLFGFIWRRWSRAYQWSHPPMLWLHIHWLAIKGRIYGSVSGTYMGWYTCALIGVTCTLKKFSSCDQELWNLRN